MVEENKIGQALKAHCGECGGLRNCDIRGHYVESGGDDYVGIHWRKEWYLLVCKGCEHVFAQYVATNSEDIDYWFDARGNEVSQYAETVRTWPARAKRKAPDWFSNQYIEADDLIDTSLVDAALKELYGALDADLLVLGSIGVRTSFDVAAVALGVDAELSFNEKTAALEHQKHILEADKDKIQLLVEAGSASAHRGWKPTPEDLSGLMDVLEEFIFNSFVAPARKRAKAANLEKIKASVPTRSKKTKNKT